MRLFVTAWPSDDVRDLLEQLPRRDDPAVRWTLRAQWHVTLAFLGEVDEEHLEALHEALRAVGAGSGPREVALGPATRRLGRNQLVVPVAGLDDVAAAVAGRTATALGRAPERRPFRGHLTLARSRGRRPVPTSLEGTAVEATWTVDEVALVRSHLGDGPARYETLRSVPLAPR